MTHEEKQIHNDVHAELREFEEFKKLVKKMRDAQSDYEIIDMAYEYAKGHRCADRELVLQRAEAMTKAIKLEDEVDEFKEDGDMKIHKWKNYNTRWILPILSISFGSINTTIGIGWWKWHMEFIFPKTIDAPFKGYEK